MDGGRHNAGFLFLYELFTRTCKCRLYCGSSHTLATLLLQLYSDSRGGGLMGSILNILANNPDLCTDPSIRYLFLPLLLLYIYLYILMPCIWFL